MPTEHQLVHYTKSVETVCSILQHGFVLIPNKRHLIHALLPKEDFSKREPQEFGMASFTELALDEAREHRSAFGQFGIGVEWDWASRNDAQRVLYIDEDGFIFNRFSWLFELARQEMEKGDKAAYSQGVINKNAALVMGAQLYHAMLTFYEYMEPSPNSAQIEWRIVNQLPTYHSQTDRASLVAELVRQAKISSMGAVKIAPHDVAFLTCRAEEINALRRSLPDAFKGVPIHAHSTQASGMARALAKCRALAGRLIPRERIRWLRYDPPQGSVLLPMTDGRTLRLPMASRVNGIALYPDRVQSRVRVAVQYEDESEKWYEIQMPIEAARQLCSYLNEMERDIRARQRSSDS